MGNSPNQCCYCFTNTTDGIVSKASISKSRVPWFEYDHSQLFIFTIIYNSKIKFIFFCHLKLSNRNHKSICFTHVNHSPTTLF